MTILIDHRVGSKDLYELIPGSELAHLDSGDVMISGNGPYGEVVVGVERKKLMDLINSMQTGRLMNVQLPNMQETFHTSYVFVEGICRSNATGQLEILQGRHWVPQKQGDRNIQYGDIVKFLCTIEMYGVHVWRTQGRKDTACNIRFLAEWWRKDWHSHGLSSITSSNSMEATLMRPDVKRRIAAQLPGVGAKRSHVVASHFPTVGKMIKATPDEWLSIKGLGEKTVRTILDAIHKESK